MEAEYYSIASATKELMWISYILQVSFMPPALLFCDNRSAQLLAEHPYYHGRSEHISIYIHFTRHQVQYGFLQVVHVSSHF